MARLSGATGAYVRSRTRVTCMDGHPKGAMPGRRPTATPGNGVTIATRRTAGRATCCAGSRAPGTPATRGQRFIARAMIRPANR
ncbi:hypothetical protein GCM10011581_03710 [Saccharopolyspora subtropica]|uniref:Uncharacterized protein n=1 Tax=Saccharopolyspora thermophila TaxID=89367 RepID=A0A917N6Q2_9PSEU|nr:hypothetical protein GCM10011581_03710 [Saccharopolyspora subtropica]